MKAWFAIPLWQRVIGALVLGIILGRLWGPDAASLKIIGDVFVAFIHERWGTTASGENEGGEGR